MIVGACDQDQTYQHDMVCALEMYSNGGFK